MTYFNKPIYKYLLIMTLLMAASHVSVAFLGSAPMSIEFIAIVALAIIFSEFVMEWRKSREPTE